MRRSPPSKEIRREIIPARENGRCADPMVGGEGFSQGREKEDGEAECWGERGHGEA